MIRRAQAETHDNARCQFCVAGAEHLPFENESLDAVIGLGLLGNIQELDKALVEMRRVLKTGGLLLVTMPNGLALDRLLGLPRSLPLFVSWPIRTRLRRLSNAWRKAFGFAPKPDSSLRYGRSMVPGLLRRRLRGHGFTTIDASAIAFGPMRPFGAPVVSDARAIRVSMTLCWWERHCKWLRPFASTIIYTARKR
jgi:SAM-dependent methyltransferase